MKKIIVYSLCTVALIISSCAKELQTNDEINNVQPAQNTGITIKAYVAEGDITKTSYAGETTFSWVGDECLSMQLIRVSDSKRDRWVFYNDTEAGGTTASFKSSGSLDPAVWGLGEYAFYPFPGNTNCPDRCRTWNVGSVVTNNTEKGVTVSNSYKSSVSNPLQIVPMIGFKDAEDNFAFHTATGILKVTVKDIDSRLAKVQLYSEGQKLNGTFTLTGDGDNSYIAMSTTSTASEYVLDATYTDWSGESELPFYFPVPVGSLNSGFKIRLLDSSDNVLRQVSAPSAVTIERNKISEITAKIGLPAEDFSVSIAPGGTSAAPAATITLVDATSAKVVIAASVSEGEALIDSDDASVVTFAKGETKSLPVTNITNSGSAYIVAKSYSEAVEKLSNNVSIYVLSSEDSADIVSQYMRVLINVGDWTSYYYSTSYPIDFELKGDNTITIAASNDITRGNVMVTEFAGYYYDPSLNTHTTQRSTWDGFTAGTPLYANYTHNTSYNSSTGYAAFNTTADPFYVDGSSHNHYISEAGSTTLRIAFHSTGYSTNSTSNDLVVWGAKVGNFYDNTSETNSDVVMGRYVGKKTKGQIDLSGKITVSSTGANNNYSGDNLGASALIDKNASTHWHSDYVDTPSLDPEYGIFAQIDLGAGNEISKFTFNFKTRNSANQIPTKYVIGGSNDGNSWTVITAETAISTAAGKWYQVYGTSSTAYRYLRLGFTESAAGDLKSEPSNSKFVALSELQLWEN